MCFKSLTLLGLISLVALSGAKLRWKCELFDTSQETLTPRTEFVDYIKEKEPVVPGAPSNPRTPRSAQKCRPRPKNGTIGPSTQSEKSKITKTKDVIQSDVPQSVTPKDSNSPKVRYQRKETQQSNDLNIGPGFEESNDPYGRSGQPVPKRFRPTELKGADELDKPLTEHLDENVMPDFEFDEDAAPSVQEDLPWCPEDETTECETGDLTKLSTSELVELKQRCETSVSAERYQLIDKLIRTELGHNKEPDGTVLAPPTVNVNCTSNPSGLSNATLERFREECPCEKDTKGMSNEDFEIFKKECLEPIEIPGKPLVRKNGRCGALQKEIDAMKEAEYKIFVKECIVNPNITLKKILIINGGPECKNFETRNMSKSEFSTYQKRCTAYKNCDDIQKSELKGAELVRFKRICGSVTRKVKILCDVENVEKLTDEEYVKYQQECLREKLDCDSIDVDTLSDFSVVEYGRYRVDCLDTPIDCRNTDPKKLSDKEYEVYKKECLQENPDSPPRVYPDIDCKNVRVEELEGKELADYDRKCLNYRIDCKNIKPDELSREEFRRYQLECVKLSGKDCSKIEVENMSDEEYKIYERKCLRKSNCSTMDPRELSRMGYERFEERCLEGKPSCKNVKVKKLNEEEYDEFRKNCLNVEQENNCSSWINFDELSDEEYEKYKKDCPKERRNDFDCDSAEPRNLSNKQLRNFMENCVQERSDCKDVRVEELSSSEYKEYKRKCLKSIRDCSKINPDELNDKELKEYQKECARKDTSNCHSIDPRRLSGKELRKYERECMERKDSEYCNNTDPNKLSDEEYEKYSKECLRRRRNFDCDSVNTKELSTKELKLYEQECLEVRDSEDCKRINADNLSDEEYWKYSRDCLVTKKKFDCAKLDPSQLSESEIQTYKKECIENADCDSIQVEKLSRQLFQKYERKCLERTTSEDCINVNPNELSDAKYEEYKLKCLKKRRFNCAKINPEKLNEEEYAKYKKECPGRIPFDCDSVNPDKLSDGEYRMYEEECGSNRQKEDCDNINPDKLTDEEYSKYKRNCLTSQKNCRNVDVEKMSKEEYRKYEKDCLPRRSSTSDCDHENLEQMSDEEFSEYKKKCLNTPSSRSVPGEHVELTKTIVINNGEGGVSPECAGMNPREMNDQELTEYQRKCSPDNTVTITKKVIINGGSNGTESPNVRNPETPRRPHTNEECANADIESMTDYEYNSYKKYCEVNFEGESCDDVRVDKLNADKLREYVRKCGLFCGIDRKEELTDKQRRLFEKRCEGDTEELEKNCKDIVIEKLGERMYGAFAEKCLEPIDACSMLKSRRLVRKVYNEYRLRCNTRIRPSKTTNCTDADTENMTLNEYKSYLEKCKNDCRNVNIDSLSDDEFESFKKRCPLRKDKEECEHVKINELSRAEYDKLVKKCGHRNPREETETEQDCDSIEVSRLNKKMFLEFIVRCGNPADVYKPGCKSVDLESLTTEEFEDYKKKCLKPESQRSVPPGGESPHNCSNIELDKLNEKEYREYRRMCPERKTSIPDCENVDTSKLSDAQYRRYQRDCETGRLPDHPDRKDRKDCYNVKIEELSSDEYLAYKKRCLENPPRPPGNGPDEEPEKPNSSEDDCNSIDVSSLSKVEYREYKRKCGSSMRTTPRPDCDGVNVKKLSDDEYAEYQKRCGDNGRNTTGNSVSIEKTVVISNPPKDGSISPEEPSEGRTPGRPSVSNECSPENVSKMSDSEFKRKCGSVKNNCENVNFNELSDSEYRMQLKKCKSAPPPPRPDYCSTVNIAKMSDEQYKEYRKECRPIRKTTDSCKNVDVDKLSDEELKEYRRKCDVDSFEKVPPNSPNEMKCSDVKIEDLDAEEFAAYKRRCGKSPGRPKHPRDRESENCSDISVEELSAEEYVAYKKRCLHGRPPRRSIALDEDCSRVNINELSDDEYEMYLRRCPTKPENIILNKTLIITNGCERKNVDQMTKEEYQEYKEKCSHSSTPHIELVKIVKVNEGPKRPGYPEDEVNCLDQDVNTMTDKEYIRFKEKCGTFRKTFQFNCNSDVTKMTDEEFKKFRKACGKKPFNCETANVNSLTDKEYSRFLRECGKRKEVECDDAKVERMNAKEYEEYRRKCRKEIETKSHDDCNVKVEELSKKEYAEYKIRCPQPTPSKEEPPTKVRRKIDCSIVDESMMSQEEYADFKKHCNVKVTTDRYRPGENIMLTKKVEIHTGKEKFSCYDQDVDRMSDEEYSEFEKRCLKNPHFRFDCTSVDTTNLSREEYAKYQRECSQKENPESAVLIKKLIIHKTNEPVVNGCYNRNVDEMSDEEYSKYEVECLGKPATPQKPERKESFDCHNVDLSKLAQDEIELYLQRCRTRETISTTPAPRRRESLKCSGVNTDSLDDAAYQKWVRECLQQPKTIELKKKLVITNNVSPPLSGGETVIVEKYEIHEHLRPDDDEGYLEENEDFGVRVRSGTRKLVIRNRPDVDSESEAGIILVKKVIHKIPRRNRPFDGSDELDEGGMIEVKKLIMKTAEPEPDTDDYEEEEEIMRRPPKKVDPREEVVLLSVTKRHPHSYQTKGRTEEEEPTEVVKLTENRKIPNAVLREVRIRKHFGTGIPEDDAVVQEIEGQDFRIVRKTVMVPKKVRKMKSTTTTTTTPAEPEYYYDEEEVPSYITLVKVEKSSRPLRKHRTPVDYDDENVDVREDKPKSFIEYEGYVTVHGAPRKLRKKPKFTDSGEEPDIREVTRKVVMKPGGEDDDFKGVRLTSHRKLIITRNRPEEIPDDSEHQVTVVKKLKILKFGNEEQENFDDEENVGDDGRIVIRNGRLHFGSDDRRRRPEEDEEDEELVNGRIAVRGRAPKIFRWTQKPERKGTKPSVTEKNSEYYRIGGSEETDIERRKKRKEEERRPRALEEEEDGLRRRRKPRFEEESEEFGGRRRRPGMDEEDLLMRTIKKHARDKEGGRDHGETVILKKKIILNGNQSPDNDGENEEIKLRSRRKNLQSNSDQPDGEDGEVVKIVKKKVYRLGANGEKELVDEEQPRRMQRKSHQTEEGNDGEITNVSQKKVHKTIPNGDRELEDNEQRSMSQISHDQPETGGEDVKVMKGRYRIRSEDGTEPEDGEDQEEIIMKKRKRRVYRVGPGGKREIVREEEVDGDGSLNVQKKFRKIARDHPDSGTKLQTDSQNRGEGEEVKIMRKRKYRVGPGGERILISENESEDNGSEHEEIVMKKKKRVYKVGSKGQHELMREEDVGGDEGVKKVRKISRDQPGMDQTNDGEEIKLMKKRYRVGPDGERTLISEDMPEEDEKDGEEIVMKRKKKRFYKVSHDGKRELIREEIVGGDGLLGGKTNTYSPEPLTNGGMKTMHKTSGQDENEIGGEMMMMKRRKYRTGADGKRELISEDRFDPSGGDHEKIIMKKGKRRFYEFDHDGNRKLIREVEVGGDGGLLGRNENTYSPGPLNNGATKDMHHSGELLGKRKSSYSPTPVQQSDDVKPSDVSADMRPKKPPGGYASPEADLVEEARREKGKHRNPDGDGYEYEVKPRTKRTYVLDGDGNRKLVDVREGDEEPNVDLGRLLKPRKKVTETESVHRSHREHEFEHRRSSKITRSSNGQGGGSMSRMRRTMQKYHKDQNVRTSGASEEAIPEAH